MSVQIRSQKLAQAAFSRIAKYGKPDKEYVSFAKRFPALVHTCGLAQAVAFALAKEETRYVADLAAVLAASGHSEISDGTSLDKKARTEPLSSYFRLSRDTINAASWLKRYVEAAVGEGK